MRNQVKWFATRMENKLFQNDHKGGWENEPEYYFINCMYDELRDLEQSLENKSMTDAISECVDIANFAMMLADNLYRERAAIYNEKCLENT